ncbi:MAG: SIMPL domain-containing protein [Actinobacteria bacterium]|nr:SIMPL domain-containing protein [Actinomycetota bacterium]
MRWSRPKPRWRGPGGESDPATPARLDACREAAANARRKAEAYVEGLGVRLGAVLGASEPTVSAGDGAVFRMAAAGGAATENLDIQPGEQEVAATIDVTFRLEAP